MELTALFLTTVSVIPSPIAIRSSDFWDSPWWFTCHPCQSSNSLLVTPTLHRLQQRLRKMTTKQLAHQPDPNPKWTRLWVLCKHRLVDVRRVWRQRQEKRIEVLWWNESTWQSVWSLLSNEESALALCDGIFFFDNRVSWSTCCMLMCWGSTLQKLGYDACGKGPWIEVCMGKQMK